MYRTDGMVIAVDKPWLIKIISYFSDAAPCTRLMHSFYLATGIGLAWCQWLWCLLKSSLFFF